MAERLMIVLVNSDPYNGRQLASPLSQATVAAAMDFKVEVIFTGSTGEIAKKGFAEKIQLKEGNSRSVYDAIRDAHAAGVRFKVCITALDNWNDELISEVEETVGGAYLITEIMDTGTVVLTY